MATISEIKTQLGVTTLNLNPSIKDGVRTSWMRHWDNDSRIAISLHTETIAKIKADPANPNLGLQRETRTGANGDYTAIRIVMFTPAEITL